MPRSSKRVELKMGNGNGMLVTNLGVVWKLLRPSWCPHPHASLIEEVTERVRLAPAEDEETARLSIVPGRWSRVVVLTRRVGVASTPVMDGHALGYNPSKKKI